MAGMEKSGQGIPFANGRDYSGKSHSACSEMENAFGSFRKYSQPYKQFSLINDRLLGQFSGASRWGSIPML